MFLPEGFGGSESDDLYARIETVQDAVRESARTRDFCLEHAAGGRVAMLMALFVEEMAVNVVEHNERKHKGPALVDMRPYVGGGRVFFSMMDLHDRFDPTRYCELHRADSPEEHIGIRMVTAMAKEVRYYSTFNSNNLTVSMDIGEERT